MNKGIKIVMGVVVFLGILSGAFLLFAKKKTVAPVVAPKTVQATAQVKSPSSPQQNKTAVPKEVSPEKIAERKALLRTQWTQCKDRTITANASLLWNVQITEGIPAGGTYAKGNLDNDSNFPVRVIVRPDSQNIEKIKALLVVGKMAILKGTCTEVATDGAVVLQAF